jgi:TRAP-type mannitol/chloroaromatic compound transport system substrate-binding protein
MKRRSFLKKAAAGLAVGSVAAPAVAQTAAMPTVSWRMASSFPKSLDTLFGSADELVKRVAAATDNKFQIRLFAGGEIVPGLQVLDAAQNGTVECGHTANYYYIGKNPAFAFDTAMGFGMNARQQNAWMYYGGGRELMNEFFKTYSVHAIPAGNTGAQMGGWYRKEIKTVADLKGLKMRIGGLAGQIIAKLGAVPTQIAGGEIYQALERGTIDAAEWVGPYDDEKLGFNKVAKFYYYPGWWEPGPGLSFIVNRTEWAKLPKDYQSIFEVAAYEANVSMAAKYDALNPGAFEQLTKAGVKLRKFSNEILRAAQKEAFDLYNDEAAKGAQYKKIFDGWKKFRDGTYKVMAVHELGYENFAFNL